MMFEYNPAKSAANLAKHGIDFEQAKALWDDELRIEAPAYGLDGEAREITIGMIDGKIWAAITTLRDEVVRIISVRRAREKEVAIYEGQDDQH